MSTWNSTFKAPGKPLRRSPMKPSAQPVRATFRRREKRVGQKLPGLAQRVAMAVGTDIRHARGESDLLRSETHRRNVADLGCLITGRKAQACHVNFGKGMAVKTCDSLCFPLAPELHREHDQGGLSRLERWRREWEYVDRTRSLLIRKNQWPAHVEAAYQRAIVPLARVVHPEAGAV